MTEIIKEDLLTNDEILRIKGLAELSAWFINSVPRDMINDNYTPFIEGVNDLQRLIMTRAAQRAFPELFKYDPERDRHNTLSETFSNSE